MRLPLGIHQWQSGLGVAHLAYHQQTAQRIDVAALCQAKVFKVTAARIKEIFSFSLYSSAKIEGLQEYSLNLGVGCVLCWAIESSSFPDNLVLSKANCVPNVVLHLQDVATSVT